ncbi:TPA: ead/Ea22-like family protein [Klebsiella pneumoniae]|nr:ead/Ea22-like family protein [Klebsiella pneumoniae]
MTDITELAQRMSIERIKQIALGGTPTMGERESLAITALHFAEELKIATDAFQAAGLAQLAAEEALEKAQSANEYLREQSAEWERKAISNFEDCAEMSARIEELESQRKLAFAASNRWADKFREAEQRIAELESRTVTAAAADVLAERKRQVAAEWWTPEHDDEYEHGELADAAGCYALSSELFDCAGEPPRPWPWPDEWWKPTNRRRDLVKAGALILAEIERLDRAAGIKVEAE